MLKKTVTVTAAVLSLICVYHGDVQSISCVTAPTSENAQCIYITDEVTEDGSTGLEYRTLPYFKDEYEGQETIEISCDPDSSIVHLLGD
jgi:hypothetical protein